jgi:nucleoside-diphosphate-sugar epimerase
VDGFTPFYARGLKARNVATLRAAPAFDLREPRSTAADLGRTRRELGWTPRTPLEHGLRRQVEHA